MWRERAVLRVLVTTPCGDVDTQVTGLEPVDETATAVCAAGRQGYALLPIRAGAINSGTTVGSVSKRGKTHAAVVYRSGELQRLPGRGGEFSGAADINQLDIAAGCPVH